MKSLVVLATLFVLSCASVVSPPPTATAKPADSKSRACVQPPEEIYGAVRDECTDIEDVGFCCGFVSVFDLGPYVVRCIYLVCREACDKPFHMGLTQCGPISTTEEKTRDTQRL